MNPSKIYRAALRIVAQSLLIHPDWDFDTHIAYLQSEAFIDTDTVIEFGQFPNPPKSYPLWMFVDSWIKFPTRAIEIAAKLPSS
jgi:hypothetical protein